MATRPARQRVARSPSALLLCAVLALTGGVLLVGGIDLMRLSGSAYYALAGVTLLGVAFLLWRGNRWAPWLHGAFLAATWIWALWESGVDGWALLPRVAFFSILSLAFLLPAVMRHCGYASHVRRAKQTLIGLLVLIVGAIIVMLLTPAGPQGSAPSAPVANATIKTDWAQTEWPSWGNDQGGQRFGTAAQITPANVGALQVAWTYRTGAAPRPGGAPALAFEVTPLKIDDTLYGCTPHNVLFALDSVTGKELWRHDPQTDDQGLGFANCRGVAYADLGARGLLPKAGQDRPEPCSKRIYTGTIDARLLAVDALTGQACQGFGVKGAVDLRRNITPHDKAYFYYTSSPTVSGNVVVLGSYGFDGQRVRQPSGVIRAYDLVTGQQAWDFDPAAPDRTAPLTDGEVYEPGTPNSWSVSSTDEALGLVYVPLGVATPDYYGGERSPAARKFSNAILALDNRTGALRWFFQTVHHDVWDYDVASQPVLTDFPAGGTRVPALVSISKTGETFVLDRRTGKPLAPIVERQVPRGDAPGETYSPTQPFSPAMPNFAGDRLQEREMWGLTPFDQLWCRIAFRSLRYEGRFTPPSLKGSLQYPGFAGGVNWGSFAIDVDRGLLLVNSNRLPSKARLITRAEADARGMRPIGQGVKSSPEAVRAGVPQAGARFAVLNGTMLSPLQVPCLQPPMGELTAVDLASRRVLWKRALGTADRMGPLGVASHIPLTFGLPGVGGPLVTRGGLTFIAATPDRRIRAIETRTGKVLWQADLPANGNANPMTYVARDGRQYVVIAAGGSGALATNEKNILTAFALPR